MNKTRDKLILGWTLFSDSLVVLEFNATLTTKVIIMVVGDAYVSGNGLSDKHCVL